MLRWPLTILLLLMAWLLLVLPAFGWVVSTYPMPAFTRPTTRLSVDAAGVRRCGAARLERVGGEAGIWHLHLDGDAAQRGWDHGQLVGDRARALEREMMTTMTQLVPTWPARHLLLGLVGLNNRTLDGYFTVDERIEIASNAEGARAAWPTLRNPAMPHYSLAVQYHALHDISHYLIDNPLVRPPQLGCTAVAVQGRRTADGRVLVGRLFDFEGGRAFDLDKVVQTVHPVDGIPFINIAWPGAVGAVTGLNQAGLWASINAGESAAQGTVGRPSILAVREILQTCRTLAEAEAVLRRTPVFVSETVLLASGPERRAIAVEVGPTGCDVRSAVDDALVVTNHFCCPRWDGDPANRRRIEQGTSPRRFARAQELLDAQPIHDPTSLLTILRDRRAVGGQEVGFANRGTINAWIGAHLVVADLSTCTVWVCAPPHGLGAAYAFTVDGPVDAPPLPESPDRQRCDLALAPWNAAVQEARSALAAGDLDAARRAALVARWHNPDHFITCELLAATATDADERQREARRGLAQAPAYADDRERLEALLP